jgi:hypothetical protein
MDIFSPRVADGYLPSRDLKAFVYRHALRRVDEREADLVLREVQGSWPFASRRVAPKAVVAADLADSLDARARRAGATFLRRLKIG